MAGVGGMCLWWIGEGAGNSGKGGSVCWKIRWFRVSLAIAAVLE